MLVLSIFSIIGLGCAENYFLQVIRPQEKEVIFHKPSWKELDSEEYQLNIDVEILQKRSQAIETVTVWLASNAGTVIAEEEEGPDDGYLEKRVAYKTQSAQVQDNGVEWYIRYRTEICSHPDQSLDDRSELSCGEEQRMRDCTIKYNNLPKREGLVWSPTTVVFGEEYEVEIKREDDIYWIPTETCNIAMNKKSSFALKVQEIPPLNVTNLDEIQRYFPTLKEDLNISTASDLKIDKLSFDWEYCWAASIYGEAVNKQKVCLLLRYKSLEDFHKENPFSGEVSWRLKKRALQNHAVHTKSKELFSSLQKQKFIVFPCVDL